MKMRLVCLCVLLTALYGCVGAKTFEEAQAVSAERLAALNKAQGELVDCRAEADRLKKEQDQRASEVERLKKEQDQRAAEGDRNAASMKARLDALIGKGDAAARELAAIKAELERAQKEKEFTDREIERLRLKAGEIDSQKEKELANLKSTYDSLVQELKKEIEKGDIKITRAMDRLSVNMVDRVLFDSGSAGIKPEGLKVLKRVGEILKSVTDRQIRIEGHTDNVPIVSKVKERFQTNWELSAARATNVVRYLQDFAGVNPALLSAAGFSEYRPSAANETAEGREQNRRIEIVLLPLDVDRVLDELKGGKK